MAWIDFSTREITASVVYWGARGSGARTAIGALAFAHDDAELAAIGGDQGDEALRPGVFVHTAPADAVPDFTVQLRVYFVSSDLPDPIRRHELLNTVDALVFVADGRSGRSQTNLDAMLSLEKDLTALGVRMSTLPMTVAVQHKGHPEALDAQEVAFELNAYDVPVHHVDPGEREGLLAAHNALVGLLAGRIREKMAGDNVAMSLQPRALDAPRTADEIARSHDMAVRAARTTLTPEMRMAVPTEWAGLQPTAQVEVPYLTSQLVDTRPVHILGAHLDADFVHVDLVVEARRGGGDNQAVRITLMNQPMAATPVSLLRDDVGPRPPQESPWARDPNEDVTAPLPDRIQFIERGNDDLPPVWYGVAGVSAGALIGLLLGFLLFV